MVVVLQKARPNGSGKYEEFKALTLINVAPTQYRSCNPCTHMNTAVLSAHGSGISS
jgi:hypothetical protein